MSEQSEKVRWAGPIGFEGVKTGDGRYIEHDALEWDVSEDNPFPLRWVGQDVGAHANAESVGVIDTIERKEGGVIWGEGWIFTDTPEGDKAAKKVANKSQRGISMDLDDVVFEDSIEDGDDYPTTTTTSAGVRSATIVTIPAFEGAVIDLVDEYTPKTEDVEDPKLVKEVITAITDELATENLQTESHSGACIVLLPEIGQEINEVASEEAHMTLAWLGPWAELEQDQELSDAIILQTQTLAETMKPITVRSAERGVLGDEDADVVFIERSEELNALREEFVTAEAIELRMSQVEQFPDWTPHVTLGYPTNPASADVPEDWYPEEIAFDRVAVWYGGSPVEFPLGGSGIPAEDPTPEDSELSAKSIKDALEEVTEKLEEQGIEVITAASAPVDPPLAWFQDPGLIEPTPITITDDGRIYGHLAEWDSCHTANPAGHGVCVSPPSSPSNYSRFHLGSLKTAEGKFISVGKITMGTGHAGPKASPQSTLAHYDNTGTAVADVRCGEDAYGIWVAGAMRPNVSDSQIRVLRASPLSGDWRGVDGSLELHAALAVNVPGFPIPQRRGLVASGELQSLVASGVVITQQTEKAAEEALEAAGSQLSGLEDFSSEDIEFLKSLVASAKQQLAADNRKKVTAFANRRKVESYVSRKV